MVSIIILVFNQLEYTKKCLESLFNHTSQIRSPFEVIIVDNNSTDGTAQYLQGLEQSGQIKVIYNMQNAGFPKGNNQAAAIAKGEYLLLLNNDTLLTEGWLEKLLRCIKSDSQIAAVGPYTSHSSGYQQVNPQPEYKEEEGLQIYARKFSGEEKYVDFLVFFCVLIKRKVWDKIGGLDEDFGRGNFEDNLFCYRAIEKGCKLKVAGDCFIHHYAGQTWGQKTKDSQKLIDYVSLMARNQKIFLKKINRYETISLCMIVSDQEKPETLKKCLDSVVQWVDEICLVFNYNQWSKWSISIGPWRYPKKFLSISKFLDSQKILHVFKYVKFTDFSDMRNKSLALATSRYVLWLDADDFLETPAGMRDIILRNPHIDAFKCRILSMTEQNTIETIWHSRLFRRAKNNQIPYWTNRCHEDLSYSMNKLAYQAATTDITIRHLGYLDRKLWRKKNERNLKLMIEDMKEIKSKPELEQADKDRLSMIYYGIINALIILASFQKESIRKETLVEALLYCDECLKLTTVKDPLTAKIWMCRGVICMDAGEKLAAKQSLHKAYDEWQQPEAAINLAEMYIQEKNWNKAIEILDVILNKYQGAYPLGNLAHDPVQMHTLLLEKLGHAWAHKAQDCKENVESFEEYMKKAEAYYRDCINIRPKLEVVNLLIQILRNTNRLDEACFMAIKAVNKWPGFFVGWYYIGEYEQLNNRMVTARLFYQECLRLKPGYKEAVFNMNAIGQMAQGRKK